MRLGMSPQLTHQGTHFEAVARVLGHANMPVTTRESYLGPLATVEQESAAPESEDVTRVPVQGPYIEKIE